MYQLVFGATLPETTNSHLNMVCWKTFSFPFGARPIFKGELCSFMEGVHPPKTNLEPENDALEDVFSFSNGGPDSQVNQPLSSQGDVLFKTGRFGLRSSWAVLGYRNVVPRFGLLGLAKSHKRHDRGTKQPTAGGITKVYPPEVYCLVVFEIFLGIFFPPKIGGWWFPIWLVFFKWVETTN